MYTNLEVDDDIETSVLGTYNTRVQCAPHSKSNFSIFTGHFSVVCFILKPLWS